MKDNEKLAVVLFNLGGPLREKDIRPFLFNFFMDKHIIKLPKILRYLLASYISIKRSKYIANKAYRFLGYKSPLLENTIAQAKALEFILKEKYKKTKIFISMRYWHPLVDETIKEVIKYSPDKIILLPLYPQFSTTTSLSSLESWYETAIKYSLKIPTKDICCYIKNEGFISASIENIKEEIDKAPKNFRLIFSAHGLPKNIIEDGDPYQYLCEETVKNIIKDLKIDNLDYSIAYQSKVGKLEWITPSLNEEMHRAGKDKKAVIIYPLSFVSEHVETLVELDIEYRDMAHKINIPYFARVQTVGTNSKFIKGLENIVLSLLEDKECDKLCTDNFKKCYKRIVKC